jgi:hypothetical protein
VRKPLLWLVIGTVALAAGLGLYWFAPWKLFTNKRVDDAAPVVVVTTNPPASASAVPLDRLLASGTFVSHEHHTTGTVQLVARADGRRQLVLRDLSTSDGPDVWVWLSDQPVGTDPSAFGRGHYVPLAKLKGNQGNQVYDVPAEVDLGGVRSVSLWCRRFSVSFGAAALSPA